MKILSTLALLALGACNPAWSDDAPADAPATAESSASKAGQVRQASVDDLAAALPGVFLVDVRTPGEYAQGHVAGTVNIPLDQLSGHMSELEPHKQDDIWVICASGHRSGIASEQLAKAGYKPINVEGGTGAWVRSGKPVEK